MNVIVAKNNNYANKSLKDFTKVGNKKINEEI